MKTTGVCETHGETVFYEYKKADKANSYKVCRDCRQAKDRVWAQGPGRAYVNASRRKQWASIRDIVFRAYGNKCSCEQCPESDPFFLTIDHVNGSGTKHRKEIGGPDKLYRWIRDNGFPKEFRVLCHNCNSGRWRNGGICPHEYGKLRLVNGSGYLPE